MLLLQFGHYFKEDVLIWCYNGLWCFISPIKELFSHENYLINSFAIILKKSESERCEAVIKR